MSIRRSVRRSGAVALYNGQLFVLSPRPSTIALCEFARELIQDAFGSLDPRTAQHSLPVEEYAAILAKLKPYFIHHPKSKQLLLSVLAEAGCDLDKTYFDVPKMRSSTSGGYLTSGIAYAWHPHRDTWYSAPSCQVNWWIPILRNRIRQCDGIPPAILERAGSKQLRRIQPVRGEQERSWWYGRHLCQGGSAPAAQVRSIPSNEIPKFGSFVLSAESSYSRERRCTRACRTPPDGPDSALIFAPFTWTTWRPNGERRISTPHVPERRWVNSCAPRIAPAFPEEVLSLYYDGTENLGDLAYRPSELNTPSPLRG